MQLAVPVDIVDPMPGDMVLATAYARELPQYGLKVGLTNYAAGTFMSYYAADWEGKIKYFIEKFIQDSSIMLSSDYVFMQLELGLVSQYAVPLLEEKSEVPTRIAYMDTQDIASLTLIALRSEKVNGKFLPSQDC
ncbi:NAD(P)-binding domain-containing protein [Tanacetum coccineum]